MNDELHIRTDAVSGLVWATAWRAHRQETTSGDAFVIAETRCGLRVGLVDGLGHGPEAHEAARCATRLLEDPAEPHDLLRLVERIDAQCRRTRGVVLLVADLDLRARRLRWLGVGNIAGLVLCGTGDHEHLITQDGIVGFRLPTLRLRESDWRPGDRLVMTTDGVDLEPRPSHSDSGAFAADASARRLIEHGSSGDDDALALVVDWPREVA